MALPVSLESIFQMSFNVVDQIIVGLLGATAVAAVGLSNSVAAIAILLCAAVGTGTGVLIAQAYGRKDMDDVSRTAAVGQTVAGTFGAIAGNGKSGLRTAGLIPSTTELRIDKVPFGNVVPKLEAPVVRRGSKNAIYIQETENERTVLLCPPLTSVGQRVWRTLVHLNLEIHSTWTLKG